MGWPAYASCTLAFLIGYLTAAWFGLKFPISKWPDLAVFKTADFFRVEAQKRRDAKGGGA